MKAKTLLFLTITLLVPVMLCTSALAAPNITVHPVDQIVTVGTGVTFTVTATGAGTLYYQWTMDGVAILDDPSAITDTLTFTATSGHDGAMFRCAVTDDNGTVYSQPATLTVLMAPVIISHPEDQTVMVGFRATFRVVATGNPALVYQWQRNVPGGGGWTSIPGANASSYRTLPTAMADDQVTYRCRVTNSMGNEISNPATLTVTPRLPSFIIHPQSRTLTVGENAVFRVWALGTDLEYQWQKQPSGGAWTNIAGATAAAYSTGPVNVTDHHDARYRCRVNNQGYAIYVYSNQAILTIVGAPTVTTHPADQTVDEGETATFSIVATDATSYQWEKLPPGGPWGAIPGATGTSYTTPPTTMVDDQTQFRCMVTNSTGTVASGAAVLTVLGAGAPVITTHPADQTVYEGQTATFNVVATGTSPLSYQWEQRPPAGTWTAIPGATNSSYTTPLVAAGDDQTDFRCIVTNTDGTANSAAATLTVLPPAPPVIITDPMDQTVCEGGSATFNVVATDSVPLNYQWQEDPNPPGGGWNNIAGANSASYTTMPAVPGDNNHRFRCQVSNAAGSVDSAPATLTVVAAVAPVIVTQPLDQTACVGQTATFTVAAADTCPPFTYQWQEDSGAGFTNVPGATSPSYTTPPVAVGDDGDRFRCRVTNAAGNVFSNPANLTVDQTLPTIVTHPLNQTVCVDQTATFTVEATGPCLPLSYQWQRDDGGGWADIAGANSPSHTTPPIGAVNDADRYRCRVSNTVGNAFSDPAVLSVDLTQPTILTQPVNQTACIGQTATFTVEATHACLPLTYQWRENGVDIPGATGTSYTTPAVGITDDLDAFVCRVTSASGVIRTTNAATLTVDQTLPSVTGDPQDQVVCEGDTATFTVVAASTCPGLTYQWQRRESATPPFVDIPGANSATYTTPPVIAANDDLDEFRCQVSNDGGTTNSAFAILDIDNTVPTVTTDPSNQTVCEGQTATFTVVAESPCPGLTYQWQRDSGGGFGPIAGATSASYTTPPTPAGYHNDLFRCRVTNAAGSTLSGAALLTLDQTLPTITTDPSHQTVCEGQPATFSVVVTTGCPPVAYQWQRRESAVPPFVNISGATSATYTTPAVTILNDDLDEFRCRVTNAAGFVDSNFAVLTVDQTLPTITTHPADQTICEGQTATFSVVATAGCPPLTYQWQRDSGGGFGPIAGATSATYTTPVTHAGYHNDLFRCRVTNAAGTTVSNAATLTLEQTLPTITTNPSDQTICQGQTATFSVVATTGCPPLTYQWQRDSGGGFGPIAGATSASYTTPVTHAGYNNDLFRCRVTNAAGTTDSSAALLTLDSALPTITTDPADQTICQGQTATFTVVATSLCPITYQWQRDSGGGFINIPGATSASYTTPVTHAGYNNDQFRCRVINAAGVTVSGAALLTLDSSLPTITTDPADLTVCEGQSATFTVVATSICPVTYQWQRDSGGGFSNIVGATSASYTTPPTTPGYNNDQFRCRVINTAGTTTSAAARLTLGSVPPTITTGPADQTVCEGDTATFSVVATTGCPPVTYQWQRDSGGGFSNIVGATSASYTTPPTTAGYNNDLFRCRVTNTAGTTTSAAALLTLDSALPTITTDPVDQTVCEGDTATFSVVATTGCPPVTYQWQRDSGAGFASIVGATSASYTTPPTTAGDNNDLFRCRVTNATGTTTSAAALLTLDSGPPTITTNPTNETVCEGETATFSVVAAGPCPITGYQWQFSTNGGGSWSNVTGGVGQTAATFTTVPANIADDGVHFRCQVTNAAGTTNSLAAVLTVGAGPPTIITNPANQTVCEGDTATFSVVATSPCPITGYQWQFSTNNGGTWNNVTGGIGFDTATFTTVSNTAADDGVQFRCQVTNAAGTTNSLAAILTVGTGPPTIITNPANQTVCEGETATFTVVATSPCPITGYQWQFSTNNGGTWNNVTGGVGQTAATFTTVPTNAADDGVQFRCQVTNAAGTTDSLAAVLTVDNQPPTITTNPANQTVCEGDTATFSVVATTGCPPMSYQWRRDSGGGFADIPGATSDVYTTPPTVVADDGDLFLCRVTNVAGSADSAAALLTLESAAPTIISDPSNQTVCEGETATFTVVATNGCLPLSYQWRKHDGSSWADIPGATSDVYTTPPTVAADDGDLFLCRVTTVAGSADSAAAILTLHSATPTITTNPASQTVTEGQTAAFTVVASSPCLPVSYQWRKDTGGGFANISGATSATYTTPPTVAGDDGTLFLCRVTNSAGSADSAAALLTVDSGPPIISQHPQDQTVNEGDTAMFSVVATGPAPLSYQWLRDGIYISGANSTSYTTDPTVAGDDGAMFSCEVSNGGGTVTSNEATLTVLSEPTATFPFLEDFESGALADYWTPTSSGKGRIQVTTLNDPAAGSYHLTMDSRSWMSFALNELVLNINLSGQTGVTLSFYHKEVNDNDHVMPTSFTGSDNSDGVAISEDGTNWHKVQGLTSVDSVSSTWQCYTVDLDAAAAAAGITYNSAIKIKFQQYGNMPIVSSSSRLSDGFAFDDIELY